MIGALFWPAGEEVSADANADLARRANGSDDMPSAMGH
jgi:hypothetical protein